MEDNTKDLFEFFKENKHLLTDYAELRIRIFKLELLKTSAQVSGLIIWLILSMFLMTIIFLFGGLSIGFLLGEALHSNAAGFSIITGFFLLVLIICVLFRKQLFINPVIQVLIKQNFQQDHE